MTLELDGAVAVVTGAGSGIGRATAIALAARGCHLALVERNPETLEETATLAATGSVRITRHALDVTDAAGVAALPAQVAAEHGKVTILLNNAGVGLIGRFEEISMEEFRWLLEINLFGTVSLTKAFLPVLRNQAAAQIVNVSSLYGIIAPAGETAYSASKFAVRGFSEALRHELAGTGIGVTIVHPGGIKTGIAIGARVAAGADPEESRKWKQLFHQHFLRMPPERAAKIIVRAIERRQKRLLIGADARVAAFLQRALPVRYWKVLEWQARMFFARK
jgi:short-subunit dehydrogenase